MAKVTGPLMSLDARGTIGKAITFSYWKGVNYVRARVIPNNPNTTAQQAVRGIITDASVAWKNGATVGAIAIDAAYKLAYETAAAGTGMSGFNLFIKECHTLNYIGEPKVYDGSLEIPTTPGDITPGA